jgi:bisphosphoglycerate-dependent phosphoglycerate mutase
MSELQTIQSTLERAASRRRLARGLRGMWQGLLIGAILAFLSVAAYHVYPLPLNMVLVSVVLPLPCMITGFIIGAWRKPDLAEVARWVDSRTHMQERLSTALEVAKDPAAESWRDLVLQDAASHSKDLDPRSILPFHLPKATRWALVVLALAAGLGFVPEYRSKSYVQKQNDQQVIKEVGKQLADLTKRSLDKRPPALEPTQKAMEAAADLGDQLSKKAFTRNEALKDLANVTDKLKEQLNDMAKNPDLQRMQESARAGSGKDSQTTAQMQKQLDALQKQLGTPSGNPEDMDKARKELDKLREAAKAMSDKNGGASDAEKQKMSESLSALSKQMQQMGMRLPQLDDAIAALSANQTDLFLKDLNAATTDLEKMRDMAKSMQQMQQQMEKAGKDLAEQLKNGQPEVAAQTLEKMMQQLKDSNLSKDQMQKLTDEVSKAIDPAGNYGKVADHLKNASQQMKSGQQAPASQSLADAAKELQKLAQQMGDAQTLMAELENLDKASQCVGQCKSWGMCNKPGSGQGGKPGGGVGTWADEKNAWMYDGQWSDHWDNSGQVRPGMTPKGQSDRGPGELSDALKPTKVKGRFSSGGQMPSITLKGVSIKGASKVEYEEAVAAAQSDAQAALSQEKVPRAYQGAVKDYFDEKK